MFSNNKTKVLVLAFADVSCFMGDINNCFMSIPKAKKRRLFPYVLAHRAHNILQNNPKLVQVLLASFLLKVDSPPCEQCENRVKRVFSKNDCSVHRMTVVTTRNCRSIMWLNKVKKKKNNISSKTYG